ncbi:hypothetical protein [Paraburkholderia sp. C35]|uniref:hypothetical protein n=1 Tax=Paraburkholderia sp. C35 TaxID=2126993 RepID=UPI000D687DC1|nr:hypothetical protein [Paraburkholderia sp. C35]
MRFLHIAVSALLALFIVFVFLILPKRVDSMVLGNTDSKTVQLYDGGKLIGQWTTAGSIDMPHDGHGAYQFRDAATGHLIQVTGTVVITAW